MKQNMNKQLPFWDCYFQFNAWIKQKSKFMFSINYRDKSKCDFFTLTDMPMVVEQCFCMLRLNIMQIWLQANLISEI